MRTECAMFLPSPRLVGAQATQSTLMGMESFPHAVSGNPCLPIHPLQSLAHVMCMYSSQLKEQVTGTLKTRTSEFQSDQVGSEF